MSIKTLQTPNEQTESHTQHTKPRRLTLTQVTVSRWPLRFAVARLHSSVSQSAQPQHSTNRHRNEMRQNNVTVGANGAVRAAAHLQWQNQQRVA